MNPVAPRTSAAALLLAACFAWSAPALARASRPSAPPAAVKAEFDAFLTKFRAALKANDASAVAGMTRLPFMGEADNAKFRAREYPKLFDARARACLQRAKAVHDVDGENNPVVSMFCGPTIYVFTRTPAGFRFTDVGADD